MSFCVTVCQPKKDMVVTVVWARIRCAVFHKDVTHSFVPPWIRLVKPVTHGMGVGLPSAILTISGACHAENKVMPERLPVKAPGLKMPRV